MTFHSIRLAALKQEWRHEKATCGPYNQIGGLLELIEYAKPKSVIEIGSHYGVSTETFLLHCHEVAVVDPWPDYQVFRSFLGRCSAYPNLRIERGTSPEELGRFAPRSFDMCYIDGEHSDKDVTADINGCLPLVTKWIAGHDWHHAGVARTVRRLLGEPEKVFSDSSWIVKAPESALLP